MGKGKKRFTNYQLAIITLIVTVVIGAPTIIFAIIPLVQSIPSSNLDVLVYESHTKVIYNQDNTTCIGFDVSFSAQITNTGNIPVTVAAYDIFPKGNIPNSKDYIYSNTNTTYLKPTDSFNQEFSKHFNASIPVETGLIPQYVGAVIYRDNSGNVKSVTADLSDLSG